MMKRFLSSAEKLLFPTNRLSLSKPLLDTLFKLLRRDCDLIFFFFYVRDHFSVNPRPRDFRIVRDADFPPGGGPVF